MDYKEEYIDLLEYWSTVERFNMPKVVESPRLQGFRAHQYIHSDKVADRRLPWKSRRIFEHKRTPDKTKIFNIFVGYIEGQKIVDAIVKCFPVSNEYFELSDVDHTSLLNFQVNEYGEFIEGTLAIPQFLTYLACLKRKEASPNSWLNKAEEHKKKLEEIYSNLETDIESRANNSVTYDDIAQLFVDILKSTGLQELQEQALNVALVHRYERTVPRVEDKSLSEEENEKNFRKIEYYESILKKLPAPTEQLFDSFYLRDLTLIQSALRAEEGVGKSLDQYLSGKISEGRKDFLADLSLLQEYSAPDKMTSARWPCKGSHPLAIAQQIAVNLTAAEDSGIMSVNGPPGTGKTTLLRDIVADVAVKRAERMLKFSHPLEAFELTKLDRGTPFWRLDDRLKGLEIVLASNNNNAVENISKELPRLDEVETEYGLDYFSEIASEIIGEDAWGVAAAALGNKNNCTSFIKRFWILNPERRYDESIEENPYGLRYLLSNIHSKRVDAEIPDWNEARRLFRQKLEECNGLITELEKLDGVDAKICELSRNCNKLREKVEGKKRVVKAYDDELKQMRVQEQRLSSELDDIYKQISVLQPVKPSKFIEIWETIFGGKRYSAWIGKYNLLYTRISEISKEKGELSSKERELQEFCSQAKRLLPKLEQEIEISESEMTELHHVLNEAEINIDWLTDYPDETFWSKDVASIQLSAPWMHEKLHKVRGELFVEAMNLTKAFILNARTPIVENMDSVLEVMTGGGWKYKHCLPDLWASFFTVVPLVSTTFASFSRLFDGMMQESLGYLLVDEAGQATVQSAAGAIFRSKRVIAVGDPMQVEPVITIPKVLNKTLLDYFSIPDKFSVKSESVQTCSDRVNRFGGYLKNDESSWVGCPLRVHRRCLDPMFTLSNNMAYSGMMVYATSPKASPFDQILLDSIWIDVKTGEFDEHWRDSEGEAAYKFIMDAINVNGGLPSLYVISPFKSVADRMQDLLNLKKDEIRKLLNSLNSKESIKYWIENHVGTVHRFQGKQADVTMILLGGNPQKPGAFTWASGSPNILNVAITRAKKYIVVIGNRDRWSSYNYFNTMAGVLEVKTPQEEPLQENI